MGKLEQAFETRVTRRNFLRLAVAAGTTLTAAACGLPIKPPEKQQVTNLGLRIDESEFWNIAGAGPVLRIITQTGDKNKMDHLITMGDLYMAEASPKFIIAINRDMAEFIFKQADLAKPSLPTRILFVEDWLEPERGEQTGGYTAIADDRSDQVVVISLKAASYEAIKDLQRKKLPLEDQFDGAVSFFVSKYVARLSADAGSRTKKLLRPGSNLIPNDLMDATKPQLDAFEQSYTHLYNEASVRNLGLQALIFVASLESNLSRQAYINQILQEAKARGIE